mmetsp:Transcript_60662/g.144582  ORF Transcript_60662/g.144582 Transcript_60662/m.144582 type:complete len:224 (+) Transcript_60662:1028-1699(+)
MYRIQLKISVKAPISRKVPRQPWITWRWEVAPASKTPSMKPLWPKAMSQPKARPRSFEGQVAPMSPCDTGPRAAPTVPAHALTTQSTRTLGTKAVAAVTKPHNKVAYISSVSLQARSANTPQTSTAKLWKMASTKTIPPRDTGVASSKPSSSALKIPGSIAPSAACSRKTTARRVWSSWKLVRPVWATKLSEVWPCIIKGIDSCCLMDDRAGRSIITTLAWTG